MKQVKVNYLKDYQACPFQIQQVHLTFELKSRATRVTNRMRFEKTTAGMQTLSLNGEQLKLLEVRLNDELLPSQHYQLTETHFIWSTDLEQFELSFVTEIHPAENTTLEGLYQSGGNYCTQCEAEGFRRITYYLDRPDIMSLFTTKIIADKTENPVLLSNGNLIEKGELDQNQHFAVWYDPHKKPCYLFALVAGNLQALTENFITQTGRHVMLEIYTDPRHLSSCHHAMASLVHAMRWDEARFGCEYDLERYMIVAVDDFNMGAMENKGLNIFNSKFVLARPETATDVDFEGVEAVIAHEYFHNWTGNRVTCRDWFQLTLKEGLTVFRDQEFTADRLSPSVKRIEDVRRLRAHQFAEDAGPMRHPIQPQSYIEMNNFYTTTVYEKGAEVVRLYQTLLGKEGFRKGMDLYFARHDGQAVTVEDFRNAMADANQIDLIPMQAWYTQAGTPILQVQTEYQPETQQFILTCEQTLAHTTQFTPFIIPIKLGLLDSQGNPMLINPSSECSVRLEDDGGVLQLTDKQQSWIFTNLTEKPTLSILRDFSAPVKLDYSQSEQELAFLAQFDSNDFNRWEAVQRLAVMDIKRNVQRLQTATEFALSPLLIKVYRFLLNQALENKSKDLALTAYALTLPELSYLLEQYDQVDLDCLIQSHRQTRLQLAHALYEEFESLYKKIEPEVEYRYQKQSIANRIIRNRCLSYMLLTEQSTAIEQAVQQYQAQHNMTDVLAALEGLSHINHPKAESCLQDFYQRWQDEPLVLDKWFSLQTASQRPNPLQRVEALLQHPKFVWTTPNRVRSVIGVFARQNLIGFHRQDGLGYAWLTEQVIKLDQSNPQIASRLVVPLTHLQKFDSDRQNLMLAQLKRLKQEVKSNDVYEWVVKSLEAKSS